MTTPTFPETLELSRGRARLEPLASRHAPDLLAAAGEDEIWMYMPAPRPRTSEDMRVMIDAALAAREKGNAFPFAVVDRATGRAVGSTRYLDVQPANRALEIGWTWYGAGARRTSTNTECKYLLLRHAFEAAWSGGANRVQLQTDARNARSREAILRIGARFEGILRKNRVIHNGFVRDTAYFSIVRDEWPAARERLESMLSAGGVDPSV